MVVVGGLSSMPVNSNQSGSLETDKIFSCRRLHGKRSKKWIGWHV